MAGSQKKVVVRPFSSAPLHGYLQVSGFTQSDRIALLDLAGRSVALAVDDIKTVSYVRDFNTGDKLDPERIGRRHFVGRPRGEGLWVRILFRDGDSLEGLADTGLALIDAAIRDRGLFLTPPEARSNSQRVYVPRSAMAGLEILGVVTTATRPKVPPAPKLPPQPGLFEDT